MNDDSHPAPPATREQFLTARQLADILQVSQSTVHRLARQGRIPSVRITSRITRFHLKSVRDALDGTRPRLRRANNDTPADDPQLSFQDLLEERG